MNVAYYAFNNYKKIYCTYMRTYICTYINSAKFGLTKKII